MKSGLIILSLLIVSNALSVSKGPKVSGAQHAFDQKFQHQFASAPKPSTQQQVIPQQQAAPQQGFYNPQPVQFAQQPRPYQQQPLQYQQQPLQYQPVQYQQQQYQPHQQQYQPQQFQQQQFQYQPLNQQRQNYQPAAPLQPVQPQLVQYSQLPNQVNQIAPVETKLTKVAPVETKFTKEIPILKSEEADALPISVQKASNQERDIETSVEDQELSKYTAPAEEETDPIEEEITPIAEVGSQFVAPIAAEEVSVQVDPVAEEVSAGSDFQRRSNNYRVPSYNPYYDEQLFESVLRNAPSNAQLINARDSNGNSLVSRLPSNYTTIRPHSQIVDTFSCEGRIYGYYADMANDCQIFHICLPIHTLPYPAPKTNEPQAPVPEITFQFSFICPKYTAFSQDVSVCAWSTEAIPCQMSEKLYDLVNSKYFKDVEKVSTTPQPPRFRS